MAAKIKVTCQDCKEEFVITDGDRGRSVQLRCERCGKEKWFSNVDYASQREEIFRRNESILKRIVRAVFRLPPPLREEHRLWEKYYAALESLSGRCECGGELKRNAPARCPKCRSARIERGEILIFLD